MNGPHSPLATRARSQNVRRAQAVSLANRLARVAARLEDLEFLAAAGAELQEAAHRAGFPSVHAMARFLYRQDRHDLYAALRRQTPGHVRSGTDHHRTDRRAVA